MLDFPRWKITVIAFFTLLGITLAMPNFLSDEQLENMPAFLPTSQITLGLDLQGGAHLLMGVDTTGIMKTLIDDKAENIRDELRDENIRHRIRASSESLTITLVDEADRENALSIIGGTIIKAGASITNVGSDDIIIESGEGVVINITLSEAAVIEKKTQSVEQSIEIVRRRIDEMGTKEPTIQQNGADRILIQVPGIDDPKRLKDILGQTAQMNFHLTDTTQTFSDINSGKRPPTGTMRLPSYEKDLDGNPLEYYAIKTRRIVSGEDLVQASQTMDQDNQIAVSITFNTKGGKQFADATRANVGNPFAIVLDGEVISAPRINSAILGGSAIITGGFSTQEASDLALLLRAGALPAPLEVLEERTVGPNLGADSVAAGKVASLIGLAAVMVYIALSYGFFGIIANFSLSINILLIFGVLSMFGATLTLPGIAGIVLTVGMAVDANVLIFERIREELSAGKKVISAIDVGYSRALSTIIDANVTTLIAALILFQFGSGPIKGFAVTLAAGILTSVFTAVSLSRLIIVTWVRKKRPAALKL
ncbi:MAG: protein translocase subunit SecD [Kordiimonadaceae bacterium]|jgi:preprotein translocase subunit SecD|nr:protein translocase subunit SecD [Kordiimonadaceae bacterium]MBT6032991.1 protein translocase subunit SecD [Kordiimonadaceae bacterium]